MKYIINYSGQSHSYVNTLPVYMYMYIYMYFLILYRYTCTFYTVYVLINFL